MVTLVMKGRLQVAEPKLLEVENLKLMLRVAVRAAARIAVRVVVSHQVEAKVVVMLVVKVVKEVHQVEAVEETGDAICRVRKRTRHQLMSNSPIVWLMKKLRKR